MLANRTCSRIWRGSGVQRGAVELAAEGAGGLDGEFELDDKRAHARGAVHEAGGGGCGGVGLSGAGAGHCGGCELGRLRGGAAAGAGRVGGVAGGGGVEGGEGNGLLDVVLGEGVLGLDVAAVGGVDGAGRGEGGGERAQQHWNEAHLEPLERRAYRAGVHAPRSVRMKVRSGTGNNRAGTLWKRSQAGGASAGSARMKRASPLAIFWPGLSEWGPAKVQREARGAPGAGVQLQACQSWAIF